MVQLNDVHVDNDGAGPPWSVFLRGLPKTELHVHLVGTIEPRTAFSMARRNGVQLPWESVEELAASYQFADLQAFLDVSDAACGGLRTDEDYFEMTDAYLARARQDGVIRSEMFLAPQGHLLRGASLDSVMDPVLEAIESGDRAHGVSGDLIVSIDRASAQKEAFTLLERLTPWLDRVAGFGLAGPEAGHPPTKFADFFQALHRDGFKTSAHAGEEGPAAHVRDAVDVLHVDRVDHGVACMNDPEVVELLRATATPLTVCPLSNVRLQVVGSIADHPLRRMLRAGLNVSVHSDDPPYFGGYLTENLMAAVVGLGLDVDEVLTLVRNGHRSAWNSEMDQRNCLDLVDAYIAASGTPEQAAREGRLP